MLSDRIAKRGPHTSRLAVMQEGCAGIWNLGCSSPFFTLRAVAFCKNDANYRFPFEFRGIFGRDTCERDRTLDSRRGGNIAAQEKRKWIEVDPA